MVARARAEGERKDKGESEPMLTMIPRALIGIGTVSERRPTRETSKLNWRNFLFARWGGNIFVADGYIVVSVYREYLEYSRS